MRQLSRHLFNRRYTTFCAARALLIEQLRRMCRGKIQQRRLQTVNLLLEETPTPSMQTG